MCPSLTGKSIDVSPTVNFAAAGVDVLLGASSMEAAFLFGRSTALKLPDSRCPETDVVQCNITYRIVGLGSSCFRWFGVAP